MNGTSIFSIWKKKEINDRWLSYPFDFHEKSWRTEWKWWRAVQFLFSFIYSFFTIVGFRSRVHNSCLVPWLFLDSIYGYLAKRNEPQQVVALELSMLAFHGLGAIALALLFLYERLAVTAARKFANENSLAWETPHTWAIYLTGRCRLLSNF